MQDGAPPRPGFFSRLRDGLRGTDRTGPEPVPTVRVSLNAYGKLPIYKDFISAGLTEPGAREFRNWIDRGFSHRWSTEEGYRETEIPKTLFLLRLPDSGVFVAGCLWGSRDEGGLRKFPFTLFAALPEGHRAADPLAATEHLEVLDRQGDAIGRDFGPGGSLAGFYRAYRGAAVDLPVKPARRVRREAGADLERVTVGSLANALYGAEAAARWPSLLSELEAVGSNRGDEAAFAVRLPLSGALPRALELQFWLLWLAGRDSRRADVVGFLCPSGNGAGRAALFFRDLRPEDILLLHPRRSGYPYAKDLAAAGAPAGGPAAAVPADWDRPLSSLLRA